MKAVIHILYNKDDVHKNNLFCNKSFYDYTFKHFLITNECILPKTFYKNFEQIFYIKDEEPLTRSLFHLLNFIKEMGYTEVCINNCRQRINSIDSKSVEELIKNFSVIIDVIDV